MTTYQLIEMFIPFFTAVLWESYHNLFKQTAINAFRVCPIFYKISILNNLVHIFLCVVEGVFSE